MSGKDSTEGSPATLAMLRAALDTARVAPPAASSSGEEDDNADIATPRAKAAAALEHALRARMDWHWDHDEQSGEQLCRILIDMCAWHEHAQLRDRILDLQVSGVALLEASAPGEPRMAQVDELNEAYQAIKPRADDAEAIAAALGMSLEEAQAFGLIGTLAALGVDDEEPAPVYDDSLPESASRVEDDLETVFRREAYIMVTKTLPQALQRFWGAQHSMDAMISVRRGFHTLKGDARVTAQMSSSAVAEELEGLAVLAEATEDIIDYLLGEDYDTQQPAPPMPPGAFSVFNEIVTALVQRLAIRGPLENEAVLLRRLEGMQRKAAALSGTPIDEETLAAKMPPPSVKKQATPLRKTTPAAKPVTHSLLPTFLEEADRLMPDLHRALATLSDNSSDEGALVRARVKLHTLKGGAALIGEEAVGIQQIAHSAENLFELIEDFHLRGEMSAVPKEVLDGVLDAEDALQALIDILRKRGQSGRIQLTPTLSLLPEEVARRLDTIAEQVRRGAIGKPTGADSAAFEPIEASPTVAARSLTDILSSDPVQPVSLPSSVVPLLQRVEVPITPKRVTPLVGLTKVNFRDLIERGEHVDMRSKKSVTDRARAIEARAKQSTTPFTLFCCVQRMSHYVEEQAHYRELAARNGQVYIFGQLDVIPAPEMHITLVPLETGDALLAERVAIFDAPEGPSAFIAYDAAAESPVEAGRRYQSAHVEDPTLVHLAAGRLRTVLRQDASLIADRRAALHSATDGGLTPLPRLRQPVTRKRTAPAVESATRPTQEFGKEYSVNTALAAIEDLSVHRDALQELVSSMARQSIESRRSSRRLRTLVERVGSELAGLRSELVRTTRRAGDWDLLEKEEYTTVDVLLMQLDEALADLEESDTELRRDLGEARAQVEIQADSQFRAQRALLDMSMIPLSQIEDRLNHAVRSQSRRLNKQVAFHMEGGDLLLDGRIAQSLFEPMMHLINNALDHGIEDRAADRTTAGKSAEGHLTIRGRASGDGVAIDVIDDGRGIDPERVAAMAVSRGIVDAHEAASMSSQERLALVWRPGFSTARTVTAVSGRGIGMKSVLDDITSLQGRVTMHSVVGKGTTFTITLPRSLAMLRVEVVREGHDLVALPITQVVGTYAIPYKELQDVQGGYTLEIGSKSLTVSGAHLANGPAGDGEAGQAILLEVAGRSSGIVVDEVLGSQYLPVRSAPAYLRRHCGLLGYAVGGGGRILPIIDLTTLIDRSVVSRLVVSGDQQEQPAYTVLVVDDSQTMRRALRDTLTKAGFLVREAADGREALTTCTRAMPNLITLDMEMPGMDGLEALSALRLLPNGGAGVPVFMITSRQQARHRAAALAAGVTRYFTKPYDTDELIGAAQLVLAEGMQQSREVAS